MSLFEKSAAATHWPKCRWSYPVLLISLRAYISLIWDSIGFSFSSLILCMWTTMKSSFGPNKSWKNWQSGWWPLIFFSISLLAAAALFLLTAKWKLLRTHKKPENSDKAEIWEKFAAFFHEPQMREKRIAKVNCSQRSLEMKSRKILLK